MTEFVKSELESGILTLTLTRPDKMNAITNAMYAALADALENAEKDPAIRVVVFQGDGDHFTAGNDMGDFAAQSKDSSIVAHSPRFIKNLGIATKPLIAAVQGNAVGIGTTMLLHCDLVYVAPTARLITPFVNIALVPEAASTHLLQGRIGYARAYEMFALGEPVDGATAASLGLVNAVVPVEELRKKVRETALKLASRPAGSLSHTKALMRDTGAITAQIDREGAILKERLQGPEAREALAAFAERRKPDFSKIAS
ncbi:MAG TPA: enoyl-CoA hydratase [Afipia sp.]